MQSVTGILITILRIFILIDEPGKTWKRLMSLYTCNISSESKIFLQLTKSIFQTLNVVPGTK